MIKSACPGSGRRAGGQVKRLRSGCKTSAWVRPGGCLRRNRKFQPVRVGIPGCSRGEDVNPQVYFHWAEGNPVMALLGYLVLGGGDVPPLTREILRRAEPRLDRRPQVHVG
ncbi:hypothetical protein SAMN05216275_105111 [Streptosporangium canum]|uniref:Uncharacterized protein n=1 Tax=Streptosporangium canum TaxID=324952 RepID=A0A1I3LE14_9ACTN|nr:hypothetical protein SAMN05216275_105111 [Streptosporangium canum]